MQEMRILSSSEVKREYDVKLYETLKLHDQHFSFTSTQIERKEA